MTTTTECSDINSTKTRRRATVVLVAGPAAVAAFALFGIAWPGAAEATVASGSTQLADQATAPSLRVQDVDDSDDDEAQLQQNLAMQQMLQSEQQAEQQNEQAEQQALQDELQAQQTEQQANQ